MIWVPLNLKNLHMNILRTLLGTAALAGLAAGAEAAVVLGNLSVGTLDYVDVTGSGAPDGSFWYATQFTTGTGAVQFHVNSLTLNFSAATTASGNFQVEIRRNVASVDGDTPGSVMSGGVLSGTADPSTAGNYSYTASTLSLLPNTDYWVVARVNSGDSSYSWNYAQNGNNSIASNTWDITGATAYSGDQALSWIPDNVNFENPYKFEIDVTAVPEPSEYAACGGVAALGVAGYLRRRRAA